MSHPAKLIEKIRLLIERDYPSAQYRFITEKAIPGTRMHPDIQVLDGKGKVWCAVEIGYTRPEKLTAYRKDLNIPDVRWYDKQGNLHADVEERVIRVNIETEPQGVFSVYRIDDMVECVSEVCRQTAIYECEDELPLLQDPDNLDQQMSDYRAYCTTALVTTDYVRVWASVFCDKCGEVWAASKHSSQDIDSIESDLRWLSPQGFADSWGKYLAQGSWSEVRQFVKSYLGTNLSYSEGEFITPSAEQSFYANLSQLRLQATTISVP